MQRLQLLLQLSKYSDFYVVRCLGCFQEFYIATYFFFTTFIKYCAKLYLDQRFELNSDLKAIVEMTRPNISPELCRKLLNCQATSCTVKRSFSMLRKLLAKDRHLSSDVLRLKIF